MPIQSQLVSIFFHFFLFDLCILYNCFFLIYYLSIVIDPRFKLCYYQKQEWEQHYIDMAKKIFNDTFKNFYQDNVDTNNRENINDEGDFFFNILGGNNNNDYNEVETYLQQPPASIRTDPLQWWKTNENTYPQLAKMARDYLAIPGKYLFFLLILSNIIIKT